MNTPLSSIILVLIATCFGAVGPIYIKKGTDKLKFNFWALIKNTDLIIGVVAYLCATFLFIPALKNGELSLLYPIVSLGYIWVSLLSTKMLGEKMTKAKWLAVVFILVGITFIGIGS